MLVRLCCSMVTVLLLLAGCSDDAADPEPESGASPTPSATETPTTTALPTPSEPPELAPGDTAVLDLTVGRRSGEVAITVARVDKGTIKDLQDFVLQKGVRTSTPYYAHVRVENRSRTDLTGGSPKLWGLDSTNTVLPPVHVRGWFATCERRSLPRSFIRGDKARTCLMYLVPKGARLAAVQYRYDDGITDPVSWALR